MALLLFGNVVLTFDQMLKPNLDLTSSLILILFCGIRFVSTSVQCKATEKETFQVLPPNNFHSLIVPSLRLLLSLGCFKRGRLIVWGTFEPLAHKRTNTHTHTGEKHADTER